MRHPKLHGFTLAAGIAAAMLCASSALADDTEIFISQPSDTVQSNILLVIDSSGSMNESAGTTQLPYDPTQTYSNSGTSCQNDRIYYSTSGTAPNTCSGLSYIQLSSSGTPFASAGVANPREIKCAAAVVQLVWGIGSSGSGFYSDRFIRWRGSGTSRTWQSSLANANGSTTSGGTISGSNYATDVECLADSAVHGPDATAASKWPRSGANSQIPGRWTSTSSESWWSVSGNTGLARTLYSPNYINYVRNGSTAIQTRMDVVKAAAASFLNSLPNVNLGVMRYDAGGLGGMVMSPVSPLEPKRADLIAEITKSGLYEPYGNTPLSETLFEAYRYFSGGNVGYGNPSRLCTDNVSVPGAVGSCLFTNIQPYPSVPGSRIGDRYISPAADSCQSNYIVYLTDGLPTSDNDADVGITSLPNFSTLGGVGCAGAGSGRCLGALSEYMYRADLRSDVVGQQNVTSYYIGFGSDVAGPGPVAYLQNAATRGGGTAYTATDLTGLTAVFNAIVTSIFQTSTTFTTPTVAVNAFNRTQTLEDLFVSVFQPNASLHWPGNIKKYRVVEGVIKDQDANNAVDPNTGFFADGARSYWSPVSDGSEVKEGGASSQLPLPANRRVYTYLGANPGSPVTLTSSVNYEFSTSNTSLTATALSLGAPGDPTRDDLINWARGQDLTNEDGDAATLVRYAMGDPIHSPPEVVIYGGTVASPDLNDAAVYVTTNDGYLHAFDVSTGVELWSFIPQEFLPNLKELYFDNPVPSRQYTLDGEIRVLRYDVNGDGVITSSSNDRVILYFGMGRGGNQYYAIDVTNKAQPKYMWTIGASTLPGVGQAWSKPVVTRVNVSGATQNSQRLVLVMGGGYDPQEDGVMYLANAAVGNRVYIVDALRGTLLWHAGPSGSNLNNTRMTHSIPGAISVLDTDSDGYADRMYAGDLGAQIWRWDITNGNAAGTLVAGGVIASLGTHDDATPVAANARKFYSSPDVSAVQRAGTLPFINIAIGSGYRGHPLNTVVQDRFYSVRDHNGFRKMTQTEYNSFTRITDATLQDITTDVNPAVPAGSPGWKLFLNRPAWRGEKSLSPSNTFSNIIFFTTYTPPNGTSTTSCGASSTGTNRAYLVNALSGAPIPRNRDGSLAGGGGAGGGGGSGVPGDNDGDGVPDPLTPDDRYDDLKQGGIAPEIAFLFPGKDSVVCLSGVEVLGACRDFDSRVKTYWRESGAN